MEEEDWWLRWAQEWEAIRADTVHGVMPSRILSGAPPYGRGQGLGNKGSRIKKNKVSKDWASAEATGLGKELGRKAVTIGVRSDAVLKL